MAAIALSQSGSTTAGKRQRRALQFGGPVAPRGRHCDKVHRLMAAPCAGRIGSSRSWRRSHCRRTSALEAWPRTTDRSDRPSSDQRRGGTVPLASPALCSANRARVLAPASKRGHRERAMRLAGDSALGRTARRTPSLIQQPVSHPCRDHAMLISSTRPLGPAHGPPRFSSGALP